jgi:hypothetical protein
MVTAAAGLSLRTLGASALDGEASLGPKATLVNNMFHALEPPQIIGVIIWKVKGLSTSCQGIDAIAHAWPLWVVRPETLWIWGTLIRQKQNIKKKTIRTFDHLVGRDGIKSTLQVTGCIIEQEKALGKAVCLEFKDVDCAIDLGDKFRRIEVSVTVLPWFEHNAGLSAE